MKTFTKYFGDSIVIQIKRWNIINIQENLDKVEGLLMR